MLQEVELGDSRAVSLTVLFADLCELSSSFSASQLFLLLNDYLGAITPIILEHGGYIDKYIGDGFMALFLQSPENALNTALTLQQRPCTTSIKPSLPKEGFDWLLLTHTIGISIGNVILGMIGNQQRLEGTALGDVINIPLTPGKFDPLL